MLLRLRFLQRYYNCSANYACYDARATWNSGKLLRLCLKFSEKWRATHIDSPFEGIC